MRDIYEPLSDEGFELCQPVREEDYETISRQICGTARGQSWRPLAMRLVRVDEGKKLSVSDAPWLGSDALIFRGSVIDRLGDMLRQYGECLPIDCPDAQLWFFNPTTIVDAMDEDVSTLRRFSSGKIMRVMRYAFRCELVAGVDVFKIPNLQVSPTFVSERFVRAWASAGLRGLVFNKVWSG
jgi:hypothetical protein